jgi:hypothetical protein
MSTTPCSSNACPTTMSKACWCCCSTSCNRLCIVAMRCWRWIRPGPWRPWGSCITSCCHPPSAALDGPNRDLPHRRCEQTLL